MFLATSVSVLFKWRQFTGGDPPGSGRVAAFLLVVPRRGGAAGRAGRARRPRHRLEVGAALRPGRERRSRPRLRPTNDSWRVDETYIRVKGKWRYLYRAVDSSGATIDFLLSAKQDAAAAKRFLAKALGGANHPEPRVINTDKHAAYPPAIAQLKAKALSPRTANIYRCNISTMDWNRIIGRSSDESAPVNISGLFGALGAQSPVMRRFI